MYAVGTIPPCHVPPYIPVPHWPRCTQRQLTDTPARAGNPACEVVNTPHLSFDEKCGELTALQARFLDPEDLPAGSHLQVTDPPDHQRPPPPMCGDKIFMQNALHIILSAATSIPLIRNLWVPLGAGHLERQPVHARRLQHQRHQPSPVQ
jgi:hypothetical protein